MSNHILLVGAPGVGKDYIVQHVTGNTEPITWITTTDSTTSPTNNTYPWNIRNKYYSATLSWHIVTATATATDTTSPSTLPPLTESNIESLCPPEQHQSVQALVLVYDSCRIETWEAVQSWHHYISRYNPSILLVVANHITSTSPSTPTLSAPLAWCSEYGCEHIIMPHGNTLTTSTTKSLSSSEQDHDMGCTRIVDAMHANMWNVMTRKEVTMNHGMDDLEEGEEEEEDLVDVDIDVDRDEKTHDTSDDIPDLIPKTVVDEEKQKSDADTTKKTKNARKYQRKREKKKEKSAAVATTATIPSSTSTSTSTTSSSSTTTASSSLPDPTAFDNMSESDLERSLESFSAMFDRVRGIREQAASGTMSDEMRRKQAANAIMSMLQGLGIEDEADDDSENETEPIRKPFGPEPPPKVTSDK